MRESLLGLGRKRRKHQDPAGAGVLDRRKPERRLPDAGLPLEHERGGPLRGSFDEGAHGGDLLVAADDLDRHRAPACMVTEARRIATSRLVAAAALALRELRRLARLVQPGLL